MNNSRNEMICANGIWVYVSALSALFILGGFIPPPSPDLPASEIARIFSPDNTPVRVGALIAMLGSCVFALPMLAIGAQLRRMEGPNPVMANLNNSMATLTCVANMLPCFLWLAISYKPTPPDVMVVLNDLAWFMFIGGICTQILLNFAQGVCILNDKSGLNIYPRWLGYLNLFLIMTFLPDVLLPMFTTGPFTYAGPLGFWVPAIGYLTWLWVNYFFTVKAIKRQAAEARSGVVNGTPGSADATFVAAT